jgi:hypothetical protein
VSQAKSQFDENPVTVSQLKKMARRAMAARRPLMVWGAPGLGKSEAIEQIAAEQGRPLIDLRLLLMEPTDLRGIPFKTTMKSQDPVTGEMITVDTVRWAPPEELPRIGFKDNAILFLDEISAAPPTVQAAAYQLILNRRIGAYKLPDGVDIFAAGNRQSDKGVTYRMPTPLANRFLHCTLVCDYNEWVDWAISSGNVNADIIAYHIDNKGKNLFTFNPKENKEMAFATPRSWVFVGQVVSEDDGTDPALTNHMVSGAVGEGLAGEFINFLKIKDQLPKTDDILSGKIKVAKNLTEMSAKYLVIVNLCHSMKDFFIKNDITSDTIRKKDKKYEQHSKELIAMCDNFINFIIENFEDELTILGLRTALFHYQLPFPYNEMKTFSKFSKKYAPYIK